MAKKRPTKRKPAPRVMGRPKLFKNPVKKLITMEARDWNQLQRIAKEEGVSVPQVIRNWVDSTR